MGGTEGYGLAWIAGDVAAEATTLDARRAVERSRLAAWRASPARLALAARLEAIWRAEGLTTSEAERDAAATVAP